MQRAMADVQEISKNLLRFLVMPKSGEHVSGEEGHALRSLIGKGSTAGAKGHQIYLHYVSHNQSVQKLLAEEVPTSGDRGYLLYDAYVSLVASNSDIRDDAHLHTVVYRNVQIAILEKQRSEHARHCGNLVRVIVGDGGGRCKNGNPTQLGYRVMSASAASETLLKRLPEPLRTAFRLRVTDRLSYGEIARKTNTAIYTVAKQIFEGRSLLAQYSNRQTAAIPSLEQAQSDIPEFVENLQQGTWKQIVALSLSNSDICVGSGSDKEGAAHEAGLPI